MSANTGTLMVELFGKYESLTKMMLDIVPPDYTLTDEEKQEYFHLLFEKTGNINIII